MNGKSVNYGALILDTDIGDDIDDAYALCLLMAEKANVIGVSTVYRNAVQRARAYFALGRAYSRVCGRELSRSSAAF